MSSIVYIVYIVYITVCGRLQMLLGYAEMSGAKAKQYEALDSGNCTDTSTIYILYIVVYIVYTYSSISCIYIHSLLLQLWADKMRCVIATVAANEA